MTETKTIDLGDFGQVEMGGFSAFKALRAAEQLKTLMNAYPTLLGDMAGYVRDYEKENVLVLSRTAALYQLGEDVAHLTDDDWKSNDNKIEMPRSPSVERQVFYALSKEGGALEVARDEVFRLCALALMANSELERADLDNGDAGVADAVQEKATTIKHKVGLDGLLEVFVVTVAILKEQVGGKIKELQDELGNVRELFGRASESSTPEQQQPPTSESDTPQAQPSTAATPVEAGSLTKEPSSSSSPRHSDGTAGNASTAPVGSSSATSESD